MNSKSHYDISERRVLLRIFDILFIVFSLFFTYNFLSFTYINFLDVRIIRWLFLLSFYYLLFGEIFQLYDLNISNNKYTVLRSISLTATITTVFYIFTPFIAPVLPENRLQIVYFLLILIIPVLFWRFMYMWLIVSPKFFKSVVFIGQSDFIESLIKEVRKDNIHNLRGYITEKKLNDIDGFHDISKVNLNTVISKNHITEVVVSLKGLSPEIIKKINSELIELFEHGINIVTYETFYENLIERIPKEYLSSSFYKYINFSKNNSNRFYLLGLRISDIIIGVIGLIIFTGLIPFLLIGNCLGNRGGLFYTQKRVGQYGKVFSIYKLRSMVTNAESNGAVWAKKNDSRITSFGMFLRKTRLDELPQFLNILKGEMSIIGPRPERPEFVKDLTEKIPFYSIRNVVRPGLTGWAQVNYPYANTIEEQEIKLRYDLYYIKERSTFLDFKILIKTITTVLFFKGQ
ncbi:exopolysaccharide biosynthesis polyprenyl glycosylphosphotransferase [Polaribacter sargassicola]|uniref:exopolysaccharide biosynthesis polyprenyl glycosylphosphotransferase n=1 Tax=Polaribacter sargassicola TaxID=2836891 RepID=UPI001EFFD08E|nr:exopolysaccharide biosynthesis polyprenyl glycosylphosphotransferase [Polaribacter sp. DS7-9]MCG1036619.1 exopolysaccharide biosynthesis polyprenyl glycosylphosphotransferase [Polaribacter sp. DS7-9]